MGSELAPDWQSKGKGRLERSYTGQFGQKIIETADPRLMLVRRVETFPNVRRELTIRKGEIIQGNVREERFLQRISSEVESVEFTAPEMNIKIKFDFSFLGEENPFIGVYVGEPRLLSDLTAFVSLFYHQDGEILCELQGQDYLIEVEEEPITDWREALPVLLNYLRTADWIDPGAAAYFSLHNIASYEASLKSLQAKLDPELLPEVANLSKRLLERLLSSLPMDDRDEARELLEKVHLEAGLAELLLRRNQKKVSLDPDIEKYDSLLRRVIVDEIYVFKTYGEEWYRRVLTISNFSTDKFKWEENEHKVESLETTELASGESTYGAPIAVQDYTFVIDRNDGRINITCKNNKGEESWKATFPLAVPYKEIVDTFKDPEVDFRSIKDLLQISFEKV